MKNYIWACDFSSNTGEGKLARLFVKKTIKNPNIIQFKPNIKILNYKYFIPFIGIAFCWYYFFKSKKIFYINYLPLWNFLIFLLLPPRTSIGPITGGANFSRSLLRKYLFPILYFISQIIIYLRFKKLIFSTSLLKKNLLPILKKKSEFNFILFFLKKKKIKKKNIDFLIYYRSHPNKKKFFPKSLINKISKLNLNIIIFGDMLRIKNVKNLGNIDNRYVNDLLSKTHYSIASGENLLSIFTLECINNGVKLFLNKNQKVDIKKIETNFIKIDFNSNEILNYLNTRGKFSSHF